MIEPNENDDEQNMFQPINDEPADIAQDSFEKVNFSSNDESSNVNQKNAPLKFIIKRLQHPLRSKKVEYKCQSLSPSSSIHS